MAVIRFVRGLSFLLAYFLIKISQQAGFRLTWQHSPKANGEIRFIADNITFMLGSGACRVCKNIGVCSSYVKSTDECSMTLQFCVLNAGEKSEGKTDASTCYNKTLKVKSGSKFRFKCHCDNMVSGHLPFTGGIPTKSKLLLYVKALLAKDAKHPDAYEFGESMLEANSSYSWPLTTHWRNLYHPTKCQKMVSSSPQPPCDTVLGFGMKMSVHCNDGFFPDGQCGTFTGCSRTAPCVESCSKLGHPACNPDCKANAGPCAKKASSSKSGPSASALKAALAIPLGIAVFSASTLATIYLCARSKNLAIARTNTGHLRLRNVFPQPALKRQESGYSEESEAVPDQQVLVMMDDWQESPGKTVTMNEDRFSPSEYDAPSHEWEELHLADDQEGQRLASSSIAF